jgi:redox-sensing transcriptional repressor
MRSIPRATVARLPRYLRFLEQRKEGTVSSEEIAAATGVTAAQVRKDLSFLGSLGTRGVGYQVEGLRDLIMRQLGLAESLPVVIVGAGNLGTALANYRGFGQRGFRFVALYDVSPSRIGTSINGIPVRHVDRLPADVQAEEVAIGVITTPAEAAQQAADLLTSAGVRSILNFAPVTLKVSRGVTVRYVDLAVELQILAYYRLRVG